MAENQTLEQEALEGIIPQPQNPNPTPQTLPEKPGKCPNPSLPKPLALTSNPSLPKP